ncbi:unnamed protein product [Nippostrongylus brasiliensis]|uniref:Bestrophin homolog n=1 Tax=Nippostrongylus brasiliensis TaxID=27835 RepID=A0A0N4XGS4_NIPBR|nr:unnamed protein product [Nippostrongylus brasiliensis]
MLIHTSIIVQINDRFGDQLQADFRFWDDFSALFDQKLDYIPLTFMLGFFVTIIVGRWKEIFNNIGWIDSTALLTATYLRGNDEKSRLTRRNIIRYMVLAQVLTFRDVSMQVMRRFPTLDTVVAGGLMTEAERDKYLSHNLKYTRLFLPIQWCYTLIYEARVSGKLSCDLMMNELIKCVSDFRRGLAQLCNFDWVPIPLVYPQVVFLAVRSYFFLCLIARQSVLIDGEVPKNGHSIFPLVPLVMTALQFIFYVGWMKVAESLMNPLGEDDDDFECNFLVDRNLSVGLAIVDECYGDLPPQQKDVFWSSEVAEPLYSADTAVKPMNPQIGSAAQYESVTSGGGDDASCRQTVILKFSNSSIVFLVLLRFIADLSPSSPLRRSPINEGLTSVPEEDEENQRTRNSTDLKRWRKEAKEKQDEGNEGK